VAIKNEQRKTGNIYEVQKTKTNKTETQTQNNVLDTMETTTKNINKTLSLPPTPCQVKPKTIKLIFAASTLSTQQ
jgi:hypothetical protein